jgi:hypothetical protein
MTAVLRKCAYEKCWRLFPTTILSGRICCDDECDARHAETHPRPRKDTAVPVSQKKPDRDERQEKTPDRSSRAGM